VLDLSGTRYSVVYYFVMHSFSLVITLVCTSVKEVGPLTINRMKKYVFKIKLVDV